MSLLSLLSVINCQLDDLEEDLGVAGLVGIAAGAVCLFCCCVLLVVVYCLGGCAGCCSSQDSHKESPDATDYTNANVTFGKPQYELTSSPPKKKKSPQQGVPVSADWLPNDISELEKSAKDTKSDNDASSLGSSLLAKSNVSRNPPKGAESSLNKLAIPGGGSTVSNKKKNRLSVKDIAASGIIKPFQPVFKEGAEGSNKRLYSTQYAEPPVGETETQISAEPKQRSKNQEDIKKKIAKIARGAGGGVYNTGMGTARLSTEIVDGFNLLREKKKMEAEEREKQEAEKRQQRGQTKKEVHKSEPLPTPTRKAPPAESQLSGKEKLKNFLQDTNSYEELGDEDF